MLCAVFTIKMFSNIGIPSGPVVVTPGTNPRIPTAKKTTPKSIPNVLAIMISFWLRAFAYGKAARSKQAKTPIFETTIAARGCLISTT